MVVFCHHMHLLNFLKSTKSEKKRNFDIAELEIYQLQFITSLFL